MGGKSSTSTSKVTIPPEVLARYNAVNARAEAAASAPYKAFGNTAADYVAQMNAQQNAGIAGINATVGSYQPYFNEAGAATRSGMGPAYEGIDNYMSPYIKNVADTTGAYMRQQQEQSQSGALGNAISSGAFGGDRAGIAAANLQQQNQMGYGKTMADIMNQGYTQALGASQADLARQMAGGAQLASLGAQAQNLGLQGAQAQLAAGTMQQQTEQAGKDAMIQRFMQEQGYPFQTAQFLANIAMGTGAAQGSTTATTTPRSVFGFAQGGGVSGPRTYSQGTIGGEGYVPVGDLPVGQLMVANPPEQDKDDSVNKVLELIKMIGAKNGGAIDQRHGYALDGGVSYPASTTEELRRILETRKGLEDQTGIIDDLNKDALMRAPTNPANMGLAGHQAPALSGIIPVNDVPPTTRRPTPLPSGPEEAWDATIKMGGPGTFPASSMPFPHPQPRPEGLGYQPTMPEGGPVTMPTGLIPESLAPATSPRPTARPADLNVGVGGADVAADAMRKLGTVAGPETFVDPISGLKTVKVGQGALDVPAAPTATLGIEPKPAVADPIDFFNTKIIRQESGDNQFDKNGNPLTSTAGAVGAAQVMEGTGPEAAKLAGLEWDRDRWLNDKDYNKEIGQAYFLDQYRKFGSLDKAAAAYNAGPGAVASAIDRATALGGSYLDYLPDETKGYVRSTTGMGGLGGADITAGQLAPAGGVKPYADRNMIGKFFHDPTTGKLNPNAVMSLLSGLGSMAQAQTISPIGAILAGIAGGSDTYKQLQKQTADVTATNIENIRNIQMDTMTYNEMNGTNLTPQQYASMIGASYQIPTGIGQQPASGEKMTWNQYQNGFTQVGGRIVKMQDDPVSIQKFISDNSMFPAESPIGKQVQEARQHLSDINNSGGMTIDANGEQFQIPGYSEVGNVQAKTEADRAASAKFRDEAPTVINNAGQQLAAVSTLEGVYTKMEPGKFANVGAEANAVLSALDPSNITGWGKYDLTDPSQYEIAMKGAGEIMANRLRTLPGGAPASEIDMLQTVTPTPNMQPEAIKKLLAITKAEAQYRLDYYNQYDPAIHGNDINAYAKKFADDGRTFERYVKDAMASMPRFAGESIDAAAAEAELIRRGFVKGPNGWEKP